jgi:EAL domain-containing protein (putative c-di-GMP-specific phosphodiesterase class I)
VGVRVLTGERFPDTLANANWPDAIRTVLARGRLAVHVQPIVDLQQGRIAGYEALARFPAPPEAPPDHWFREAAVQGVAVDVERIALMRALEMLSSLPAGTVLSVNVSPTLLASTAWQEAIANFDRLDRLVIELTEQVAQWNSKLAHSAIKSARRRGALLAVDDAGSGYASLPQVMRLRPDFVKIDRSVITGCSNDAGRVATIERIGAVAARIDAWLIAEGVETDAELRCLMRLGVPLAQGFLLGYPGPDWPSVSKPAMQLIAARRQRASDRADAAVAMDIWPDLIQRGSGIPLPNRLTLVLDEEQRPLSWAGPTAPPVARPLVATPRTPLRALAKRAMARPEGSRFLPVVCIDADGRYLGVVRIEHLVNWLASR